MAAHQRLGELLLASGACTREQLVEAWETKVLYGDRLGTNLLALGHIDEANLAAALGQQAGVHAGHGKVISVDREAVKLVPQSVAEKRLVVPHHVADRQLFLLMRDPHDPVAIDEAAFASGLKVTPVVVAEARIWQLLSKYYGVNLSLRPVQLDGPMIPRAKPAGAALGPELTSEEEFQRLYAGMTGAQPMPVEPPLGDLDDVSGYFATTSTPPPREPKARAKVPFPGAGDGGGFLAPPRTNAGDASADQWRDELENTNPILLRQRKQPEAEPFALTEVEAEPAFKWPDPQPTLDFHIDVADVVDETPLSFADASRVLQKAADRNGIARVVLRAARSKFKRACLLTVYPDRFVGWLGIGEGMASEQLQNIVVPRSDRSVFGLVAQSRSHYLGPLLKWPLHGAWVKATGRKLPMSLAVFPILVKGRVVNLLVVDNGHGEHVGSDVGEVVILAQQIAKTYEDLLRT